jgi:hypothetical protein
MTGRRLVIRREMQLDLELAFGRYLREMDVWPAPARAQQRRSLPGIFVQLEAELAPERSHGPIAPNRQS